MDSSELILNSSELLMTCVERLKGSSEQLVKFLAHFMID